jgi:hypothetical protein
MFGKHRLRSPDGPAPKNGLSVYRENSTAFSSAAFRSFSGLHRRPVRYELIDNGRIG